MTHTVTLISDHLGSDKPRVVGNEYVVDASIDITSYTANGETITASSLGLSEISCVVVSGISVDTIFWWICSIYDLCRSCIWSSRWW